MADLGQPSASVADSEKLVSLGCAIQNLLLGAQAIGYASGLTSGKALASHALRQVMGIAAAEQAVCFLSLGTCTQRRPPRRRPEPAQFVTWL